MTDEQENARAALDEAAYRKRLETLDDRLAEAKAANLAAADIVARAKAEAANVVDDARAQAARIIMNAEARAEQTRTTLRDEINAIITDAKVE